MGIYVWGTGCGASKLIEEGLEISRIEAFVDSAPSADTFLGKPVLLPERLDASRCELLIVTARHADAIAGECDRLGIPADKCLFLKNSTLLQDRNAVCSAAKDLLGEELLKKAFAMAESQNVPDSPAVKRSLR